MTERSSYARLKESKVEGKVTAMHRMKEVTSVVDLGSDITVPVFAAEATKKEAVDFIVADLDTTSNGVLCEIFDKAHASVKSKKDYAYVVIKIVKG